MINAMIIYLGQSTECCRKHLKLNFFFLLGLWNFKGSLITGRGKQFSWTMANRTFPLSIVSELILLNHLWCPCTVAPCRTDWMVLLPDCPKRVTGGMMQQTDTEAGWWTSWTTFISTRFWLISREPRVLDSNQSTALLNLSAQKFRD